MIRHRHLTLSASLVLLLLSAAPRTASARYAEFLPAGGAIEQDVLLLRVRGLAPGLPAGTRPWARCDVADALARGLASHPQARQDAVLRRVLRALAREIAESPLPEAADSRALAGEESPLLLDFGDNAARARASVYVAPLARAAPDTSVELAAGAHVGVRAWVRIAPSVTFVEEWHAGRSPAARHFQGDFLFGVRDFEQDFPRAYLSWAPGTWRIWAGRDAPRWGNGLSGTLLLSEAAGPRTMATASGRLWNRVTATVHHEVLSATRGRYLAAHRLEWQAASRLSVGLAEAATYVSASPEPLYWLGIVPYTMAQRAATTDAGVDTLDGALRNNLEAAVDLTWQAREGLELRAEILLDDLQLSSRTTPNRGGVQLGASLVRPAGSGVVALHGEYTRLSRHTYSVFYSILGDRDFAFRGQPLGFALGPGSDDATLRLTWDRTRDLQLGASLQQSRQGAEPLGVAWRPGDPSSGTWSFIGPVQRRRSAVVTARWEPRDTFAISAGAGAVDEDNAGHVEGRTRRGGVAWLGLELRH